MLTARDRPAAVGLNGKMYVFGGQGPTGDLDSMEIYDPATDSWSYGPAMPSARHPASAVALDGKIYVFGGDETVGCYDTFSGSWSSKAPIPVSFSSGGVAVVVMDGKIYAARNQEWLYSYDPSTDSWTARTPVPVERGIASFAALNGKLYAIGGNEPGHTPSEIDRIDVYDPSTDSWTIGGAASLQARRTHLGSPSPVVDGKIYVIGGWNGYSAQSSVEQYDPGTDTWTYVEPMPIGLYAMGYATLGNKIYTVGGNYGGSGGHNQSRVQEFTVCREAAGWRLVQIHQLTSDSTIQTNPYVAEANGRYYVAYNEIVSGDWCGSGWEVFVDKFDANWTRLQTIRLTENSVADLLPNLGYANNRFSLVYGQRQAACGGDGHIYANEYDDQWDFLRTVQLTDEGPLEEYPHLTQANDDYYFVYDSYESGYLSYLKQFDTDWSFVQKVSFGERSARQFCSAGGGFAIPFCNSGQIVIKRFNESWTHTGTTTVTASNGGTAAVAQAPFGYQAVYADTTDPSLPSILAKSWDSNWNYLTEGCLIEVGRNPHLLILDNTMILTYEWDRDIFVTVWELIT